MILYYDVCAFIILILIIMSCVLKKMFHGRNNGLFYAMILVIMIAVISDFCSGYMKTYAKPTELNRILTYFWHYLYFAAQNLILPVYLPYIYSNIGMWYEFEKNKAVRAVWYLSFLINSVVLLSNLCYEYVFYIDDKLKYHRLPGLSVFYISTFVIMLFEIGVILKHRSIIRKDKLVVMLLLYPITVIGIVIQAFIPNHLVEMFMISVALLLFSLIIKREEDLIDPVTGAGKYSAAHEHIRNALVTGTPVFVLLVKIVNFKNIRMYLGQQLLTGFLKEQSAKYAAFSRECSLDEAVYYLDDGLFSFIIETKDADAVRMLAEKIREHYGDTLDMDGFLVMIDSRICILKCPEDIDNFSMLYSFCISFDRILPDTKEVMYYSDYVDNREFRIKSELDEIIDRSLKYSSFELFYQPIYSLVEKRFVAAEAFIRLRDEVYGLISPGIFIGAAEISGAIHAIGDFVLDDVCRFISENDFDRMGLKCIEVNMSTSQCIEMNLVEKVSHFLEKYNLDASRINLEITESAVDFDPDVVDQNITKLHEMGINFALDDYGTGYSNVKRVTTLPVEIVKLDKSFIDGIDDPQMWIMVQDTVKMLKEMGKKVLVEGVEEEKIVHKFTELGADYIQGCEYMQGYYFCRPLPERDFIEFMNMQVEAKK